MGQKLLFALTILFMSQFDISICLAEQKPTAKNCTPGDSYVFPSQTSGNFDFAVCSKDENFRALSKSELLDMYNQTKGQPNHLQKWANIVEVEPSKVFETIKGLSDKHFIGFDNKDKSGLKTLGLWYAQYIVGRKDAAPAIEIDKKKLSELNKDNISDQMADQIAECFKARGKLSMGETAEGSGCFCGSQKFTDYLNYECKNDKLIPKKAAPSNNAQGAGGSQ